MTISSQTTLSFTAGCSQIEFYLTICDHQSMIDSKEMQFPQIMCSLQELFLTSLMEITQTWAYRLMQSLFQHGRYRGPRRHLNFLENNVA